ncbi:hypothetical protein C8R43DRAFT_951160 [Mycena crocata]|nr:hypothetical protein C8R43DRAFT_951160 [Mycena crocata]
MQKLRQLPPPATIHHDDPEPYSSVYAEFVDPFKASEKCRSLPRYRQVFYDELPELEPEELFDLVIDHLFDDLDSLRACALVTSSFLPSSRSHIFSHLRVGPVDQEHSVDELHEILAKFPYLAARVESLHLWDHIMRRHSWIEEYAASVAPGVAQFSRILVALKRFSVTIESGCVHWANISEALRSSVHLTLMMQTLTCVELTGLYGLPFTLLAHCPAVKSLSLKWVTFDERDNLDFAATLAACAGSPPTQLERLTLDIDTRMLALLLRWILLPESPLDLTRLVFFACTADADIDGVTIRRFIDACAPTLEHLQVENMSGLLDLSTVPHLRTLGLETVGPVQSLIRSTTLPSQAVEIVLTMVSETGDPALVQLLARLHAIDSALAANPNIGMVTLVLVPQAPESRRERDLIDVTTAFAPQMPLMAGRALPFPSAGRTTALKVVRSSFMLIGTTTSRRTPLIVLFRGKPAPDGAGNSKLPLSSKRNIKSYATSVKSSGGASMRSLAESMFSFYSVVTGSGPRVPKRRRADFSRLGVPEWYSENPPPPPDMPGTAPASEIPSFTMAHSTLMHATDKGVEPWLGLILYSHAPPTASVYSLDQLQMRSNSDAAKIAGEVRMILDKPANLSSIDVWFVLKSDSVIDMLKPPILTMKVTVWDRKHGNPTAGGGSSVPFKGKFPAGTFVFPFEFPALPTDTPVKHPDDARRKNQARVPLPPTYYVAVVGGFSGTVTYTVGVNVTREGMGAIDEEFDNDVQYLPLSKALPRVKTPFPYLPTREDWPFAREVVGGWTLTPFGGRGRLGEELVEVEGILGIQEPAVYTAGQTLEFSLMLWSANPLALEALAQPGAIEVGYYKSDLFALDVLYPKNSSRKNRRLERLTEGRIWLTDEGKPAEGAPPPECALVTLPESSAAPKTPTSPGAAGTSQRVKGAPSSRMQQVWLPEADDETGEKAAEDDEKADERAPSPVPSLEGLDDLPDPERVVRLDGEVRVPACSHPSFRYASMGREYVLHLLIKHPQYSHISPNATGIIAEVPVWYVLNRFGHLAAQRAADGEVKPDTDALPVKGDTIPLGADAVRLPLSTGAVTTQKRPTFRAQRVAAF